jgi:nitrogen fixation protein
MEVTMSPSIKDFKVYVPAKDFEQSKRFYAALGFNMSEGWGGTADFELNGNRFRLQDTFQLHKYPRGSSGKA